MSSFAWLDFAEYDRQRTLDVIDLFREKGTVDELGLGTIRDAIADILFPGTSTIMTRARYYLFVPWIYLRQERRKTQSNEILQSSRKDEIALIAALRKGGESLGVIGVDAGPALKRLPSTIYWQSLGVLGIRRFQGSRDSYHRSLDSFYKRDVIRGDDGHVIAGGNLHRWDPSLPEAPPALLKESTLRLTWEEANYLRERVTYAAPKSLFAFLVNEQVTKNDVRFPWEHPNLVDFPHFNKTELLHAQLFAEVMHGAALLYNLLLAQQRRDEVEPQQKYNSLFVEWSQLIQDKRQSFQTWSRDEFWQLVRSKGARISQTTQAFVTVWIDLTLNGSPHRLKDSTNASAVITQREKMLKGSLARLTNPRARDLWRGASSSDRLSYRWNRPVKAILSDISEGLH